MEFVKRNMEWEPLKILPVGDIQWMGDEKETAIEMLAREIRWGAENNCYFLGMGDYIDSFSPSNRHALKAAPIYDNARTSLDKIAEFHVQELFDRALKPSVGRWLGLLEGHHFHEYQSGYTSDQELCKLLEAPFLGSCGYIRLCFDDGSRRTGEVNIWCHHGVGSGQSEGYVLNKLGKMVSEWRDVDIFVMGHTHQKVGKPKDAIRVVYPPPNASFQKAKLVHGTIILAGTGGFLRGYIEERKQGKIPRGNYVEQRMLSPIALGSPLLKITPRFKRYVDGEDVSIWLPDLGVEL